MFKYYEIFIFYLFNSYTADSKILIKCSLNEAPVINPITTMHRIYTADITMLIWVLSALESTAHAHTTHTHRRETCLNPWSPSLTSSNDSFLIVPIKTVSTHGLKLVFVLTRIYVLKNYNFFNAHFFAEDVYHILSPIFGNVTLKNMRIKYLKYLK